MSTHDPREFYNDIMPGKFGEDYEYNRWHKNPIQHEGYKMTLQAIRDHVLGEGESIPVRVIELGPGAGTWTRFLIERFPESEFTLVDISKEMLQRAKKVVDALPEKIKIQYIESDILEFDDARGCDLFFSSRVLEYIPNKRAFAEKVAELLTQGGKGFLITKMPHYDRDRLLGRKASRFHTGQITPIALSGMFESAGLSVVGIYPVTLSFPVFNSPFLNALLGKIFRGKQINLVSEFFAESYCIVVTKK